MNDNQNLESSESQNKRIFAYLMEGHRITSLEALKLFGCMRLISYRRHSEKPSRSKYQGR